MYHSRSKYEPCRAELCDWSQTVLPNVIVIYTGYNPAIQLTCVTTLADVHHMCFTKSWT